MVFAFVRESHSFETILFREKNIGKFSLLRLRPDSIVGAQESRGRRKSQMQKMTRNLMGMGGAAALMGTKRKGRLTLLQDQMGLVKEVQHVSAS